jgi:hypothetical protein
MQEALATQPIALDNFSRLVNYPNKTEIPCPAQTEKTAVILAIGQSNSANHGETRFTTKYPARVLNYFNGKCYSAASPLFGATGISGEFLTPMADILIRNGDYETVILITSGIGGTPVKRWEKGGDLNGMLSKVLDKTHSNYTITDIIWHQGETDFTLNTPPEGYKKSFHSLLDSIRGETKTLPPVYYAIATRCGDNWSANNPVARAQASLANEAAHIYFAVNTDELVPADERIDSNCHFKEKAQLTVANAYALAIHKQKARQNERALLKQTPYPFSRSPNSCSN